MTSDMNMFRKQKCFIEFCHTDKNYYFIFIDDVFNTFGDQKVDGSTVSLVWV